MWLDVSIFKSDVCFTLMQTHNSISCSSFFAHIFHCTSINEVMFPSTWLVGWLDLWDCTETAGTGCE